MTVHAAQVTQCEWSLPESVRDVADRKRSSQVAMRLADIRAWLSDDLKEVETALRADLGGTGPSGHADLVTRAGAHLINLPAKRVRPLCVLLGARMGGVGLNARVKALATACELVHSATLLHDDVLDEGTERRGAPSARVMFGNAASVLAGDQMLLQAMRLVESLRDWELVDLLNETMKDMILAESLQLECQGRFVPDRATYLKIIQGKTASLFQWAFSVGGIEGGLAAEDVATLGEVGAAIGLGFQITDDLLDVCGDAALLGKKPLADLREGKLTWPFIIATEREPKTLEVVKDYAAKLERGLEVSEKPVLDCLRATDALAATRQFARAQGTRAHALLKTLPESTARNAIQVVVDAAIDRDV
ncbi:MAG TPA: polyprenyl synthetase family protein [Polyangiales bacterium]